MNQRVRVPLWLAADLFAVVMAVTFASGQTAVAQTAAVSSGSCPYWIDAATGKRAGVRPIDVIGEDLIRLQRGVDPNQAHGASGRNYVKQPDGTWIDAATGAQATTVPIDLIGEDLIRVQRGVDPNHAHGASGRNYVLIPCPPPSTTSSTIGGGYIGGELVKNWGHLRSTEKLAVTDTVTNQFSDNADPIGGGIVVGYNFQPWNNNIIVGPFASFDYLNLTINHAFTGGQFLGTTTHWFINAGVKAGVMTTPGVYVYGLAGAAFLNHDLNVNFATAAQSNTTTPGFTLGLGGEYQPSSWRLAGHPVSVFTQYQHTWWSNANFNAPASSPAYNYVFRREDDTIKLGVKFYFGSGSTQAPASK